jgi:hypothetical protein
MSEAVDSAPEIIVSTPGHPMEISSPHDICGAKKRDGTPCKSSPMPNGRCRIHGGKSLSGIASPTFRTGRYSKYAPSGIKDKYEAALADETLLEMRDEIALVEARLQELLGMVEAGESGELWKRLRDCHDRIFAARAANDQDELKLRMTELLSLVNRGATISKTWEEVLDTVERRRKLVESEWDRLVKMGQVLTYEKAMMLLSLVQDSIRRHVTDRSILARIADDIRAIVAPRSR